jgi:hypothetical protein
MSRYGAIKVAAECLIAQINSQCKLAKYTKKSIENDFSKQTNMLWKG